MFNFLKKSQIVLQNGYTILPSNQQCARASFLTSHQHSPTNHLLFIFFIIAILGRVMQYFIVVLISISLMTNIGEHLLQVLTGHLYILKKYLLRSFVHFLIELFAFLLLCYKKSLYVLDMSFFRYIISKKFFPFLNE